MSRGWIIGSAVLAAGLAAAASTARAEEFVDSKAGFRVTIPKGWTRSKDVADGGFVVRSPDTDKTFGFCFVDRHPFPQTEGLSQSEIDRRLAGKITRSYWQSQYEGSFLKNLVVEEAGEEVQNGWTTYFAIMTYEKYNKAHRFKTVAYMLPGRHYDLTCDSYLDAYARETAAFETFFDSFAPLVSPARN